MEIFRREARPGSLIRVVLKPEPADFDERVRQPGLRSMSVGTSEMATLWRNCSQQLHAAYDGICAYACTYIELVTGSRTVDHFSPKSKRADLAYELSNYRLVCGTMNARKRNFEDVLDPFEIENGWFQLEFFFFQVLPSPTLEAETKTAVQSTIDRLKLNDQDCLRLRGIYYDEFIAGHISFDYLKRRSPFVAMEMSRQGLAP